MFTINDMPLLPGQNNGREIQTVTAEQLKEIGVSGSAFAMHVGDKLEFDSTNTPLVVSQPVRKDSQNLAYYVACKRNGNNSWIPVSTFTRRDANGQPIGEFQKQALNEPSFAEVYAKMLSGKTITAETTTQYQAPKFDTAGNRLEETVTRIAPVLKYA